MLTATPVEAYSEPVYAARSILLDDLDAIQVETAMGLYTIKPFPRAKMEPAVDALIETVMTTTKQAMREQLPGIERAVNAEATSSTARLYLAAAGAGTALAILLVAAAKARL
jgi:hypothetical protein